MNVTSLKKRIAVAAKRQKADVVVTNGKIVDVFNKEIIEEDLAIVDGVIVGIGEYEGESIINAEGQFIVPGFIDGHMHIESTMVTPAEFSNVVIPHGVTSVIADPHEIANVNGPEGVQFMIDASEDIPLNVYIGAPSCVPATKFENSGATMLAADIKEFYKQDRVSSLGEVMDFSAVLHAEDEMMQKLIDAKEAGRIIDGHASGVDATGINVYRSAGILSDHECTTAEEAKERLQRGMHVQLREGSASRDLKQLLHAVTEENARRCLFVTDDKHLDDILEEGSINYNVKVAIDHGLQPITAIQMATLNTAEYFQLETKGAIAPGFDADFLLLDDLESVNITEVFIAGESIVKDGELHKPSENKLQPSEEIINSIHTTPIDRTDLEIPISEGKQANVITVIPNSIITEHSVMNVPTEEGLFVSSVENDLLKMVVMERHHAKGNIGRGIIEGMRLKKGALATTVAHDSHNILAVGTNDADIIFAIEQIKEMGGGLVVVADNQVLASVPLAISGLISVESYKTVYDQLKVVDQAVEDIGFDGDFNPFITLSFMALPVIPNIKLTDMGLFDVTTFKHIDIEAP
ncbi:MAG TPA: adenine deaminase [Bacillota bacterium]|nr:adenine deaminase [Bacillota bacterium]